VESWGEGNGARCRAESSIDSYSSLGTSPQHLSDLLVPDFNHQPCCGTLYPDKFAPIPARYLRWVDVDSFIQILSAFHRRKLSSKERNFLFSPAVFDPYRGTGKHRGTGNVVYVQNLWLDFEEGDLEPKELAQLFPQVRMLITNTFRHTAEKPRFRAIIPTTQPVTPEAYSLLYENIAWKLEDAGYFVQRNRKRKRQGQSRSGLDWSKRHPTSLFYLPCQAKEAEQSSFVTTMMVLGRRWTRCRGSRTVRFRCSGNSQHFAIRTATARTLIKDALSALLLRGELPQKVTAMTVFSAWHWNANVPGWLSGRSKKCCKVKLNLPAHRANENLRLMALSRT
jgi:hypothetical protein